MAVSSSTKALVQAAYRGGMPIVAAAETAGVSITSARRWAKDLPAGEAAASAAVPAELLADIRRGLAMVERELAPGPDHDGCYVWPTSIVATSADVRRLRRAVCAFAGGQALLVVLAAAVWLIA